MRVPFTFLLLSVAITVLSQSTTIDKPLIPIPQGRTDWSSDISMTDHLGRPFRREYNGVVGNPYYFEDWKPAIAKNASGILKGVTHIKYDILNFEVGAIVPSGDSMVIQDGFIKEFILNDSLMTGKAYLFRCGYPAIDKNTANFYYLVLSDGPLQLLKSSRKDINVQKDELSGATTKEFIQYDNYYVYRNGEMIKWKRDKDFVAGLMKDQQKSIDAYLNKNKINLKSPESTAALFDYYNQPTKAF